MTATAASNGVGWWNQLIAFIVRRRVAISIALFATLIGEDLLTRTVPRDLFDPTDGLAVAGLLGVLCGLSLRTWAAGYLIKNSELTTTGPYAFVRNPLYLGSFLMVAGFCLLIGDRENLWILSIAMLVIYLPKVRSEERLLASVYPEAWPRYAASTPRFVPRRMALPDLGGWRLSQWLRSREYNAVLASLAGLIGLVIVRRLYS